jgi:hypothetical protein
MEITIILTVNKSDTCKFIQNIYLNSINVVNEIIRTNVTALILFVFVCSTYYTVHIYTSRCVCVL